MTTIWLPYGQNSFSTDELKNYIVESGRDYIIQGQQKCKLSDHTKPQSLDYWLRVNLARNPNTKQAVNEVIDALVRTEEFEEGDFRCPDSGRICKGIQIIE
jgi:hypothetical protein